MTLVMSKFMVEFMFITIDSLGISYRCGISRSLSIAISLPIVISRMSILKAVIMALVMSKFMVKFMFITIDSLGISYRCGISRSLSIAISLPIVISRMSILRAVIMTLVMGELMVKFMFITIDSLGNSYRFGIGGSLSIAITLAIVISRMPILKTIIMTLV